MADTRTYIRVHDGMPDHPKVDGLSNGAFRLLVTLWCWCSRHATDGVIPSATWKRRGTAPGRKELIAAGLVEQLPDGDVQMHDYLEHQRSAEEIAEAKAAKSRGGSWGNHKRWHLDEGVRRPDCEHCAIAPPITEPIPGVITHPIGGQIANGSQNGRSGIASTSTDTEDKPSGAQPPVDLTKISQSASDREAANWLHERYRLTDHESAQVIAEVHRRSTRPIQHLVPYLAAMAEGHLAAIVQAVGSAQQQARAPEEPVPAPRSATGCDEHPEGAVDPTAPDGWGRCLLCNTRRRIAQKGRP